MRKGSYRNAEISRQHHRHHFSDRPDRRLRSVRADLLSTFHAHLEAPRAACQGLRSASGSRYGAAGARSVGRDRSGGACVSRMQFWLGVLATGLAGKKRWAEARPTRKAAALGACQAKCSSCPIHLYAKKPLGVQGGSRESTGASVKWWTEVLPTVPSGVVYRLEGRSFSRVVPARPSNFRNLRCPRHPPGRNRRR